MRVPKRRTKNRLEKTPQHLKSKIFPIKKSMANGPWGLGDANCALRKKRASCFTFVLECPPPACCLVAITANQNSATGNRGLVDWLLVGIPHPGQSGGGLSLGISRCFLNAGCCVALLINVTKARPCRGVRICSFFLTYSLFHLMNRPEVHDVTTKRSSREGNGAYY